MRVNYRIGLLGAVVVATFAVATVSAAARHQEPDKPSAAGAKRVGGGDKDADARRAGENPSEKRGRWAIRNGMDDEAKKIAKKSKSATFVALGTLPRPAGVLPVGKRVARAETTLWVVNARLVSYDLHADGDYHLVLKDAAGRTLVAELPDPEEVAASPFAREIGAARRAFEKRFPSKNEKADGKNKVHSGAATLVRLSGIGYFGKVQKPGLPNGLQLHPVTGVTVR